MSFDWIEYLNLAQRLVQTAEDSTNSLTQPAREAAYRSAISRAYYTAISYSRDYLDSKNVDVPKLDMHWFVIEEFGNLKQRAIQEKLRRLKRYRERADYDDTIKDLNLSATANWVIIEVKKVLETLAKLK